MAGILQQTHPVPAREEVERFITLGDLTHQGSLGNSRLIVTDKAAHRYEQTPLGEEMIASYEMAELKNPRVEDLVDASALIADYRGRSVELLRATSKRGLALAGAEKRLKALIEGKEMPEVDDATRLCPTCGRPLPEHTDVCEACVNRGQTLLRLFGYAKPYKLRLAWGTFLSIAGMVIELLSPFIVVALVDRVLQKRETALFTPLIVAFIVSRVVIMGIEIARGRNVAYLGMKITVSIRGSLFEKLQSLSLSFYDKRNVGSIMSRMTNDTGSLYEVLVDGIPVLLNQVVRLIGIPVALFILNPGIALWAVLPIPFVLIAVRWFRRKMMRVWSRFHHNWSRLSGALNGVLQGTRVVKAFHGERREVERFGRRIGDLSRSGYQAESSWASFFPVVMFTMALSTIVVYWAGGRGVLDGRMTLGQLMGFLSLVGMLQQPLMMLQRIMDWSSRALTAAERVFEVMDTPEDIADVDDAVAMPKIDGGIRFVDVHFGYDKSREILHGIELDVKPGEMIGLVGHSGAGKSTLINLLLRFYDPTQGRIELDGVDLRKVRIEDFRRQVGVARSPTSSPAPSATTSPTAARTRRWSRCSPPPRPRTRTTLS